jgi:hypothetical protein
MKKTAGWLVAGIVLVLGGVLLAKPALEHWMMSVPVTTYDQTPLPAAPDYSQTSYWAALPDRADSADWVPHGSGFVDEQASAKVDVFYVHPTAAFYGDGWVAGFDNWLHRIAVDFGILPQQASPFNGAGRIYAPRYRSVRMPIWSAADKSSIGKAVDLSYSDVRQAFDYYMAHYNQGRPVIIASHSQGTLHTIRLLRELFDGKPQGEKLVAAYLVGNTIPDAPWFVHIPLCTSATQTGCYVTWNTMLEGGNPQHWIAEKGLQKIECVNPLSWKADTVAVNAAENSGSIPMMDYHAVLSQLPPLQPGVVGAQCGPEGMLWIAQKPSVPGYTAALFPGGSYHTYDFNFYYASIRDNAIQRTSAYLQGAR